MIYNTNSTKACFLKVLRDYIHNVPTDALLINDELRCYARNHRLSAVFYKQLKDPGLSSSFFRTILHYEYRKKITDELMRDLKAAGISAFQIKGAIIASYYPDPALRTMGDTDIVVSNMEKAHSVMLNNGFTCDTKFDGREWQYIKNGLEFELHDRLVYDEVINEDKISEYLNDFRRFVKEDTLDNNFHFIFIIAHLRKHLMNSGVGFRQFLDVAVLVKNNDSLDWNWIEKQLEEIELLKFARTVMTFIQEWWHVPSPLGTNYISDSFFASATDHIFENGVFGYNNPANRNYLAANEARKESKLKNALKVLFPSYKRLCSEETFGFLRGRPILLPVVWVMRIIRGFFRGNIERKVDAVGRKFVSDKYIFAREEMFRNWGLSE